MKAKTLIETNSYLKDPVKRQKYTEVSVRSSCGVEGIKPSDKGTKIKIKERNKPLFEKFKSKLAAR